MKGSPQKLAWKKFKRNIPAIIGMYIILIGAVIGFLAYWVVPDSTSDANHQSVELKLKKPGYQIQVLKVRLNKPGINSNFLKTLWGGRGIENRLIPILDYYFKDDKVHYEQYTGDSDKGVWKSKVLADVIYNIDLDILKNSKVGEIGFETLDGNRVLTSNPEMQKRVERANIISKTYWLGTDGLGRDYLSRLVLGARISLMVGFMAVVLSLIIGVLIGSLAGYFRGWIDDVIMYFINVFWSIPTLLLALSLSLVFSKGIWQVFLAIGLTMWIGLARIVRGQILAVREQEFVEAAKSLGFGHLRIILQHLLPNIIGPVIVIVASNFAAAILLEAGLSFLGLGVERPTPSWGMMLSDNRTYLVAGMPHLAILPGMAISLFVLSFFMIGNGLRDAFDVKDKINY